VKSDLSETSIQILQNKAIQSLFSALTAKGIRYYKSNKYVSFACPFHGGDNPNAVAVNYKLNSKHCGNWFCNTRNCHEGFGDIFGFYQLLFELEDIDAVFKFLETFTEQYEYIDEPELDETPVFLSISREEVRSRLKIPSPYFLHRGFKPETLEHFDVGDCFKFGSQMYRRATVPIYKDGVAVGCTGRAIGKAKPKWRHSKGFPRMHVLFNEGVHTTALGRRVAVVVESPGNVMRMYEAGIHANGILGSKMSRNQEKIIRKMNIEAIAIATDNDEAGKRGRDDLNQRFSDLEVINLYATKQDVGEMTESEIKKEFRSIL
jgi:hypothetical protein